MVNVMSKQILWHASLLQQHANAVATSLITEFSVVHYSQTSMSKQEMAEDEDRRKNTDTLKDESGRGKESRCGGIGHNRRRPAALCP